MAKHLSESQISVIALGEEPYGWVAEHLTTCTECSDAIERDRTLMANVPPSSEIQAETEKRDNYILARREREARRRKPKSEA